MYKYDREKYNLSPSDFEYVGSDKTKSELIHKPSMTYWQDSWRRFKKNKLAFTFLIILVIYFLLAIIGPFLTKYNYYEQNMEMRFLGPIKGFFKGYYLGTDSFRRYFLKSSSRC